MKTVIEKVIEDQKICNQDKIDTAGKIIQEGGLVAFPTETVYGLGADALNPKASRKIYEAKGRPSDNPLIIHIADMKALDKIAVHISEKAVKLAEHFWPGPLTMIFEKSEAVPLETTGGLQTVAVRMPSHPAALALIQAAGGYIAAPSANTSGRPSPTLAEHVAEDMDGRIPMILDGGAVGIGIESTIVDFSEETPMILRPGYITPEMIEKIIGQIKIDPGIIKENCGIHPKAPGMKYRHYAPRAELVLVSGAQEKVKQKINDLAREAELSGKTAGVIGTDESCRYYRCGIVKSIGTRNDEDTIARNLYGILREFDQQNVDIIYSESFETSGIGQAIMNRLLKAAGQKMIEV
ncbi:MAG: threonylcarbamoyl-AMP synthase [Lachnospiraceae bacterium]|nr:threonylcarbamoyl-AMP synthase [Lachnospiraceae bacterium]